MGQRIRIQQNVGRDVRYQWYPVGETRRTLNDVLVARHANQLQPRNIGRRIDVFYRIRIANPG